MFEEQTLRLGPVSQENAMTLRRRRFKQTTSLADRLAHFSNEVREEASRLSPGPEREAIMKKLNQADAAAELDRWANSAELQPPK
jgi:hypothetical protein